MIPQHLIDVYNQTLEIEDKDKYNYCITAGIADCIHLMVKLTTQEECSIKYRNYKNDFDDAGVINNIVVKLQIGYSGEPYITTIEDFIFQKNMQKVI